MNESHETVAVLCCEAIVSPSKFDLRTFRIGGQGDLGVVRRNVDRHQKCLTCIQQNCLKSQDLNVLIEGELFTSWVKEFQIISAT